MYRVGQSELGANFGPTLTSFSSGETCRLPKTPRSRQLLPQTVWRWPTDTSHSLSLQPLDRSPSTTLTSKSRLLPKSTVRYTLRRPTRLTLPRFRELKRVIPARPYYIANMNGRHAGNTLSLTSSKQSDDQRHPANSTHTKSTSAYSVSPFSHKQSQSSPWHSPYLSVSGLCFNFLGSPFSSVKTLRLLLFLKSCSGISI
jgi:hypothetical protein